MNSLRWFAPYSYSYFFFSSSLPFVLNFARLCAFVNSFPTLPFTPQSVQKGRRKRRDSAPESSATRGEEREGVRVCVSMCCWNTDNMKCSTIALVVGGNTGYWIAKLFGKPTLEGNRVSVCSSLPFEKKKGKHATTSSLPSRMKKRHKRKEIPNAARRIFYKKKPLFSVFLFLFFFASFSRYTSAVLFSLFVLLLLCHSLASLFSLPYITSFFLKVSLVLLYLRTCVSFSFGGLLSGRTRRQEHPFALCRPACVSFVRFLCLLIRRTKLYLIANRRHTRALREERKKKIQQQGSFYVASSSAALPSEAVVRNFFKKFPCVSFLFFISILRWGILLLYHVVS